MIKGGVGAILPMLFLSFETLSCLSDMGYGSENEKIDFCVSVSLCQQYLSYYLFVALALRMLSKTVPFQVRECEIEELNTRVGARNEAMKRCEYCALSARHFARR